MAGYLPSFDSTGLLRGSGPDVVSYSTCADTARPGQMASTLGVGLGPSLRRSRRRSFRGRQRGGRCPCQMGGASRKNRGVSRKNRYTRKQKGGSSDRSEKQSRSQIGGAGFATNPTDNLLGKVPVYDTTACQMPRPPTQFGGSSNRSNKQRQSQSGGAALVGSNIGSMTQSISGTTQPSSALVYPATTAAYTFDLAGSKNFKNTYAAVAPMDGRVGAASCRSRRKGRGRK